MPDEWICQECGHSTPIDPGHENCPACGGKMANIGEVDDDLKDEGYDDEDLKTPLDPMDDIEVDDDEDTGSKKGAKQTEEEF